MKNMKKILVLSLAALLLVAVSVGGTVAYLTATTDDVTNTFTPAGIEITLTEETQSDGNALGNADWSAKLVPGVEYTKDPKVTLTKADCDVYIFITVNDSTAGAVQYAVDEGTDKWTELEDGVWYREATTDDVGESWYILEDNEVTISENLDTNSMPTSDVTIVFDAYAVQKSIGDAATAWAQVAP